MQPIHLAARYGNQKDIQRLLVDPRVKADCVDQRGKVPYEWADEFNHTQAELLLVNEIINNPKRYNDKPIEQISFKFEETA